VKGSRRACALACACLAALLLTPAADAYYLRMSFVRSRSARLVHVIVAKQHADGGRVTACYRVSPHAARCGFKTWRQSGGERWTCFGHIDAFFAPAGSNRVTTLSRGTVCRA
jgi:hypothetical protein